MAGYSVESLLAWMKETSRLWGWDAVIALTGDKVNGLLQDTYIKQLSQGIVQPVPAGSIKIPGTNIAHYLSDVILGPPQLSFSHTSFENSAIAAGLAVVSGMHMLVETRMEQSYILRMAAYEPLNGPSLSMDLQLTFSSPGVEVDLAFSEDVLLLFPGTANEQREIGQFFKAWLGNPENQARIYSLGIFADLGNPLLTVRRIDFRSQLEDSANRSSSTTTGTKGALLLFMTMNHGVTGAFPGNAADFRYLIANDADRAYSATAVFSLHVLHRAAFGYAVLQLLEAAEFEFIDPPSEPVARMVALAGSFQVAAGSYKSEYYEFQSDPFSISASGGQQPLTVTFDHSEATQSWKFQCTVPFNYRPLDGIAWKSQTATFNVSLRHEFHLTVDESGRRAMEGHLFVPYADTQEVSPASALPGNLELSELEQINGFIAYTLKRALLEGFSQTLTVGATETFLAQWALAGGNALQRLVSALPYDLAVFGRIAPGPSSFRIVQQQATVAAGGRLEFSTEPARVGLNWTVENPPGSDSAPGTIDSQGVYRAPPAHTMTGSFHRVLVIASDPDTRERSMALVTIQADAIVINPLIQVCNFDDQVKLSAGGLGEGDLQWSIKNPTPGESGSLVPDDNSEGDYVYIAGAKVAGKTYVLDEIEVRYQAGQARSAWVLVRQQAPTLEIKPLLDSALPEGQIRLQASANGYVQEDGMHWRLPAGGPGCIDATNGIYSSEVTQERFVLILAEFNDEQWGKLEGHFILPLPLRDFPEVLQALAGHSRAASELLGG